MLAGVRPTIRLASAPTARTRFVLASMATTDGSLMTIPRSRTWTSVLAVPRSIPMSREKRPRIRSSMVAGGSFVVGSLAVVGRGVAARASPVSGGSRGSSAGSGGQPGQYTRSLPALPVSGRGLAAGCGAGSRAGRAAQSAARAPCRPVERDAAVAQRDVGVVADDEVVEQLDVEQAAGGERLGGQVEVVRRRRRVARRMVVDEDDAGRVEPDRVAEELADPDQRRRHVALVDRRDAQDVVLRVEHHDPQLLALEPAHLEDQPVGDVVRAADRPARRSASPRAAGARARTRRRAGRPCAAPIPLTAASSSSVARASPVSPSWRASASAARSTADRPRVPEPQTSAISSADGQAADTAQREPLARPLRRRAPRGCARPRRRGRRRLADGSCGSATAAPPGGRRRRSRRPRARTTGARRFPPPSGPRGHAEPSDGPSSAAQPAVHRGSPAAGRPVATIDRAATSARTSRIPLNVGVEPERRPDRPAPDEQPAEREGDRDPAGERRRTASRNASPARRARDGQRRGRRRRRARQDDAAPRRPSRGPRPSWRSPEQDLLAERRDERPRPAATGRSPIGRRRSVAAG